jgi:hypothetical protein
VRPLLVPSTVTAVFVTAYAGVGTRPLSSARARSRTVRTAIGLMRPLRRLRMFCKVVLLGWVVPLY